jgi:hypothetical protein
MQSRHWVTLVPPERFADERLYAHEAITVPMAASEDPEADQPEAGQPVVMLVAGAPPEIFALGRTVAATSGEVTVQYTHRLFDEPLPVDDLHVPSGLSALAPELFHRLAARVTADKRVDADKAGWLVSLALPVEAASPAEAVREFWTYVTRLGPHELPAFVWPAGDELAMQAYVLGEPTNLDPEEDD